MDFGIRLEGVSDARHRPDGSREVGMDTCPDGRVDGRAQARSLGHVRTGGWQPENIGCDLQGGV